jgi:hypothetical protein
VPALQRLTLLGTSVLFWASLLPLRQQQDENDCVSSLFTR